MGSSKKLESVLPKLLYLNSPVQSCLKFSVVFGQMSANSSILMRPTGCPPMVTSARRTCKYETESAASVDSWMLSYRAFQCL